MKNLLLLLLAGLLSKTVVAEVRFDYTGMPVGANAVALFTPTDYVTAYFVLAEIPQTGNFSSSDFLDYGTEIAGLSLSKAQGADAGAYLEFDARGRLVTWSFVVGVYSQPTADSSLVELWANSPNLAPAGDRIIVNYQNRTQLGATTEAGDWVMQSSPIPEPLPAHLLLLGLLAIGFCQRPKNDA